MNLAANESALKSDCICGEYQADYVFRGPDGPVWLCVACADIFRLGQQHPDATLEVIVERKDSDPLPEILAAIAQKREANLRTLEEWFCRPEEGVDA